MEYNYHKNAGQLAFIKFVKGLVHLLIRPKVEWKDKSLKKADLKDSYLFYNIAQKTKAYLEANPSEHLCRMGIGDVSLPLCDAVIRALHEAVDDQAAPERFHGYMPECGAPFLREAVAGYYERRGVVLSADEIFVSSGASDELGDILDLFDRKSSALIIEPAYPAYVDANVMAGRKIVRLTSGEENGFLPEPREDIEADLLYICSPNNPTGAVFRRDQLHEYRCAAKTRRTGSCQARPTRYSPTGGPFPPAGAPPSRRVPPDRRSPYPAAGKPARGRCLRASAPPYPAG